MSNPYPDRPATEPDKGLEQEVRQRRPGTPGGWMDSIDWLRHREEKILARISEVDAPPGRMSLKPSDGQARRDALLMIRLRIAELEAEETWRGSRTRTSNPV
jgi:hypothetical protein